MNRSQLEILLTISVRKFWTLLATFGASVGKCLTIQAFLNSKLLLYLIIIKKIPPVSLAFVEAQDYLLYRCKRLNLLQMMPGWCRGNNDEGIFAYFKLSSSTELFVSKNSVIQYKYSCSTLCYFYWWGIPS